VTQSLGKFRPVEISGFSGTGRTRTHKGVPSALPRKPLRIGYIRVSTDKQNQALQLDALRAARCDRLYSDPAVSGRSPNRRKLAMVLDELRPGDTLIVWKIDRLSRFDTELLFLRDELIRRDVRLISLTQGIDTSTSLGRLSYGLLALFAAHELDQLSERTRAGMAAAKARGVHLGRVSDGRLRQAHRALSSGQDSIGSLSDRLGVSERVLRRGFRRLRLAEVR
jgi:DNA invertase Pin-like site-specific DNA recombinase